VTHLKKRDATARNFQLHVKKLQSAVVSGQVKGVQSCLKAIPNEALFTIKGPEIADFTVNPFPGQTDDIKVDATKMSLVELVCCLKHHKLLDFLFKELYVRHARDFSENRRQKQLHEQNFVFVPILNRDEVTLGKLLELTSLWTLQELQDVMLLCKHMKWSEGVETVLRSKACHRLYLAIPHTTQNVFLQFVTNLPYQLIDELDDGDDATRESLRVTIAAKKISGQQIMNPQEQAQPRNSVVANANSAGAKKGPQSSKMEYDDHERYELRRCIALALSCRPYAASYMIMDFVPKPESAQLKATKYMEIPSQLLYDKIDAAISCNESASDWELHDFIIASQGRIAAILQTGLAEKSKNVNDLGKEEFEMYHEEMVFFIDRINSHPTMAELRA